MPTSKTPTSLLLDTRSVVELAKNGKLSPIMDDLGENLLIVSTVSNELVADKELLSLLSPQQRQHFREYVIAPTREEQATITSLNNQGHVRSFIALREGILATAVVGQRENFAPVIGHRKMAHTLGQNLRMPVHNPGSVEGVAARIKVELFRAHCPSPTVGSRGLGSGLGF